LFGYVFLLFVRVFLAGVTLMGLGGGGGGGGNGDDKEISQIEITENNLLYCCRTT